MAKIRTMFGMAPTAPLADVNAEIDRRTASDKGAAAGAEVEDKGAEASTTETVAAEVAATEQEAEAATALDQQVSEAVTAATTELTTQVADLATLVKEQATTIASLTTRLETVEGAETAPPVGGAAEAQETGTAKAWANNPINQRAAAMQTFKK